MSNEWFSSWFDTPYYHQLYKNRNEPEARKFIDNLIDYLSPAATDDFLDLACGKGRHAIYLNQKGFSVEGCDLSEQSIVHAKQFENETLTFFEHDMRNKLNKKYHYILNLFTSFGYFNNTDDNLKVIHAIYEALMPGGTLVIDFMNAKKVMKNLVEKEFKKIDETTFNINRKIEDGFIIKSISFVDKGKNFQFEERVQTLLFSQFKIMINKVGMNIVDVFGNYDLEEFDENNSDRLILVAKKEDKL